MTNSASTQVGHVRRSTPRDVTVTNTYCVTNPTNCCNDNATFVGLKVQTTRYRVPVETLNTLRWVTAAGCNVPCCGTEPGTPGVVVQHAVFAVPASWRTVSTNCAVDHCNAVYDGGMLWDGSGVDYTRSSGGMTWDGTAGSVMASVGGVLWDGSAIKAASEGGMEWDGSGVVSSNGGVTWDGSGVPHLSLGGVQWDGSAAPQQLQTGSTLLDGDPQLSNCQQCVVTCLKCCATHKSFMVYDLRVIQNGSCVNCNNFSLGDTGYVIVANDGLQPFPEPGDTGCTWYNLYQFGDSTAWLCYGSGGLPGGMNDVYMVMFIENGHLNLRLWSVVNGTQSPTYRSTVPTELILPPQKNAETNPNPSSLPCTITYDPITGEALPQPFHGACDFDGYHDCIGQFGGAVVQVPVLPVIPFDPYVFTDNASNLRVGQVLIGRCIPFGTRILKIEAWPAFLGYRITLSDVPTCHPDPLLDTYTSSMPTVLYKINEAGPCTNWPAKIYVRPYIV